MKNLVGPSAVFEPAFPPYRAVGDAASNHVNGLNVSRVILPHDFSLNFRTSNTII